LHAGGIRRTSARPTRAASRATRACSADRALAGRPGTATIVQDPPGRELGSSTELARDPAPPVRTGRLPNARTAGVARHREAFADDRRGARPKVRARGGHGFTANTICGPTGAGVAGNASSLTRRVPRPRPSARLSPRDRGL
jgi:hypothetical protein